MKLTQKEINNLIVMIQHSRIDMSYGEGGTFNYTDKNGTSDYDEKEAKRVEQAMITIKRLILTSK